MPDDFRLSSDDIFSMSCRHTTRFLAFSTGYLVQFSFLNCVSHPLAASSICDVF